MLHSKMSWEFSHKLNDMLFDCDGLTGVLHPGLVAASLAGGAPEGAAVSENSGSQRRTNIGNLGRFERSAAASGHECIRVSSKFGAWW